MVLERYVDLIKMKIDFGLLKLVVLSVFYCFALAFAEIFSLRYEHLSEI